MKYIKDISFKNKIKMKSPLQVTIYCSLANFGIKLIDLAKNAIYYYFRYYITPHSNTSN